MKKLLILILITIVHFSSNAQNEKRSKAYELFKAGDLENAKRLIDETCYQSETKNHPKTWYFKAIIYKEIAKNDKENKLTYYPSEVAYKAIIQSQKLDEKDLFVNENLNELLNLSTMFLNKGSVYYNDAIKNDNVASHKKALREFDNFFITLTSLGPDSVQVIDFLKINNMPYTDILVYAGYAAYKSSNIEKSKKYYAQLTSMDKNELSHDLEGISYAFILYSNILSGEGKHEKAIDLIDKALNIWPQHKKLAISELKIYQNANKVDILTEKYEKAIVNDPENIKLMIALAEKFDRLYQGYTETNDVVNANKYREEAIETYKRAIKLNPADKNVLYNLHYNLGILYYNPAVDLYKQYIKIKDESGREAMEKRYTPLFKEAVSAFEDANKVIDNNKELIDMMTRIYLILGDMDKASEMKEKYKSLE